jgi:hypothetical protein
VSGDVVNLRRARKAARRKQTEAEAAKNRVSFGLSAAERERLKAERQRGAKDLDHHRLTPTKS